MSFVYLNLPPLPENLISELTNVELNKNIIKNSKVEQQKNFHNLLKTYYGNTCKLAESKAFFQPYISHEINLEIERFFSPYFNGREKITVVYFYNTEDQTLKSYPPHRDITRVGLGLNYLIETGGYNVETVFYENSYMPSGPINVEPFSNREDLFAYYKDVKIVNKVCIPKNTWYAFNNQSFHSVENILTKRIVIYFSLYDKKNKQITYETFLKTFKHLIKKG